MYLASTFLATHSLMMISAGWKPWEAYWILPVIYLSFFSNRSQSNSSFQVFLACKKKINLVKMTPRKKKRRIKIKIKPVRKARSECYQKVNLKIFELLKLPLQKGLYFFARIYFFICVYVHSTSVFTHLRKFRT